jgi:FkbM family methyltransferase
VYAGVPFKREVFSLLRPMHPPQRLYQHLHFKGVIRVPVEQSGSFKVQHWGYIIENELFWRGLDGWERVSLALWTQLCRDATRVIDVGANTGIYALLARCVNQRANILAVEPITRVFRKLEHNIQLNGYDIEAVCVAASDHDGTAIIYDQRSEHVLSVSLNKDFNQRDKDLRAVEIPTRTLDSLLEERGWDTVDLLKIDTESHEPEVLQGLRNTLARCRPSMLIEVLNDDVARRVEAEIGHLGYLYFNIDEVTMPPVQVPSLRKSDHFNFLVCTPEVAQRLRLVR